MINSILFVSAFLCSVGCGILSFVSRIKRNIVLSNIALVLGGCGIGIIVIRIICGLLGIV